MAQTSKSSKAAEAETEGTTPAPAGADSGVESVSVYKGGTDGGGAPAPEGQSSNVQSVSVGEAKKIAEADAKRLADEK